MSRVAPGPYGYFDDEKREYVITRPDTPRPWMNYLFNDTYVALISNTGGGVSYDLDPRLYRLLRYRYQNVPYDRPGRYVYIRDHEAGRYWSSTWAPVHTPVADCQYTCRVGMGYQIVTMETEGVRTEITYFVPRKGRLEIWDLTVTNVGKRARRLSTYSYAEFAFWGAIRDLMNIDNCPNVSRQRHEEGAILHYSYNDVGTGLHAMNFVQNYGYHTSTPHASGYNGDRDRFLGPYRDERNPLVVERGRSTNYCEWGGYPIGGLEHRFTLKPGASRRIVYRTGISDNEKTWRRDARRYAAFAEVDQAWAEVRAYWTERLNTFQAFTPDREFNTLVNGFVPYQSAVTMKLSRSISSYQWGTGRSIGFRDSSQDQLGMMHALPELARRMLGLIVSALHADGQACHDFNPLTNHWGGAGFYDDHNWPALAVHQYLRETGDTAFLGERFPYAKSDGASGTAYEHLKRAQDFAWRTRGRHGLMQIGSADWNDSLNPGDRHTESVFTSALYCASTLCLRDLAERMQDTRYAKTLTKRHATIKRILNGKAWDGAWYQRLIRPNGDVLGSRTTHEYGRIFLEPQPWAVFGGVAEGDRARRALDEVEQRLGTPDGHRMMDRPFVRFDMEAIGSAGIYPPGIKENGAVFNHASAWMIAAECMIGRGDRAFEYFLRKAGTTKNRRAARYEMEPYVCCQFVSAKPFHIVGRGRNSWLTGTAAWLAYGTMHWMLGIRPDFDGLIVDPCIPSKWKTFRVARVWRGATYDIRVRNPDGVCRGVKGIRLDGVPLPGRSPQIPIQPAGARVRVDVRMG